MRYLRSALSWLASLTILGGVFAFVVNLIASNAFAKGREAWDFVDRAAWIPIVIADILVLCGVAWLDHWKHRPASGTGRVAAWISQHLSSLRIASLGLILIIALDWFLIIIWGPAFKALEDAIAPQATIPPAMTTARPTGTFGTATPIPTSIVAPQSTSTALTVSTSTPTSNTTADTFVAQRFTIISDPNNPLRMRTLDQGATDRSIGGVGSSAPNPTPVGWMNVGYTPNGWGSLAPVPCTPSDITLAGIPEGPAHQSYYGSTLNHFYLFRQEFIVPGLPHISALDYGGSTITITLSVYDVTPNDPSQTELYVNGNSVGLSGASQTQEVDIGQYLVPGKNVIALAFDPPRLNVMRANLSSCPGFTFVGTIRVAKGS